MATAKAKAKKARAARTKQRTVTPCPLLGSMDARSTLLPNAGELVCFLDDPLLALERFCVRTGADSTLGSLAFRAILNSQRAHA